MRQRKPVLLQLIQQRARPKMPLLAQPRGHVVDERLKRVRCQPRPHSGCALSGQMGAQRLAVKPGMAGDRRDRPTTLAQGIYFHIVLPCEQEKADLLRSKAIGVRHPQHRRRPALIGGATRVGNFDERQWEISASAIKSTPVTLGFPSWYRNPLLGLASFP